MSRVLIGPHLKCTVNSTVGELFFNNAKLFKEKTCQIDASSDTRESFGSVNTRSVRLALELQKRGVTSEDVVVLCTQVTLDTPIPIIASFYLGAKVANLDPSLSVRQTTHLLSVVSPKIIFVEEESLELIEESLTASKLKAEVVVFGNSTKYPVFFDLCQPHDDEKDFEPAKVDIHDTAIIFFSSGTTGLPKAICHSHYSFIRAAYSLCQSGLKLDTILSFSSFYWISSMMILFSCYITGGHRILPFPLDVENLFSVIEKYQVTTLLLIPLQTYKLTSFEDHHEYDTSSLHNLVLTGTPIDPQQLEKLKTMLEDTSIVFLYGLTEAAIVTLFNSDVDGDLMEEKVGSCGKPAPGVRIKVADLSNNEEVGPNEKGEICVKSLTTMSGYYKADSSHVFDADGFLKTGDVGYFDEDGCVYVVERIREMFKYMCWHIVPSAIEEVLLEHPAIEEAVVFGFPTTEEEGELPTACVVLKEDAKVGKGEILKFVEERVSDKEKLRGGVFFVSDIPTTPVGKIPRKEVRKRFIQCIEEKKGKITLVPDDQ